MQGQLPWAMGGLSSQGVAPCGRRAALVSGLPPPLSCLAHVHACAASHWGLGCSACGAPHQRPREPFACALRLRHALVAGWPLTAPDGAPGLCVLARAGRCLGGPADTRPRLREPVLAARQRAQPSRRRLGPGLRGQQGHRRAVWGDGPRPLPPRALHFHSPAPPGAYCSSPAAGGRARRPPAAGCLGSPTGGGSRERRGARVRAGVLRRGAGARARGDSPAAAPAPESLGKMRPLAAYRHRGAPLWSRGVPGKEHTPNRLI